MVIERKTAREEAEKKLEESKASVPKVQLKAYKQSGVGKYINPKAFTMKYFYCVNLKSVFVLMIYFIDQPKLKLIPRPSPKKPKHLVALETSATGDVFCTDIIILYTFPFDENKLFFRKNLFLFSEKF